MWVYSTLSVLKHFMIIYWTLTTIMFRFFLCFHWLWWQKAKEKWMQYIIVFVFYWQWIYIFLMNTWRDSYFQHFCSINTRLLVPSRSQEYKSDDNYDDSLLCLDFEKSKWQMLLSKCSLLNIAVNDENSSAKFINAKYYWEIYGLDKVNKR